MLQAIFKDNRKDRRGRREEVDLNSQLKSAIGRSRKKAAKVGNTERRFSSF
jgi:hypothetical protein